MKNLLFPLSLLLLSSPLFGQETGVLYQYETSSGFVWKNFGVKDTQPKYKGQVENGKPNGQGTYTNPDGEKYVGEWKDGKPWDLTIYDKNGNIIGKWVNGILQK